jgi:hypothetical protein
MPAFAGMMAERDGLIVRSEARSSPDDEDQKRAAR